METSTTFPSAPTTTNSKMPSQSIHIPENDYEYGITTKKEGQSTSARFAELIEKGRRYEEEIEDNG